MGQNVNKKRKRERERKNRKVAVFPVRNYSAGKKNLEKNLRNGSPRFIEKTKFSMKSFYTQLLDSRCVSMMNSVILDKVITTKVDWPGRSKNLINEEKGRVVGPPYIIILFTLRPGGMYHFYETRDEQKGCRVREGEKGMEDRSNRSENEERNIGKRRRR